MNTPVTISVLTYNRCEVLKKLLSSLVKLTYRPLEIIVVDNCSVDETQEMVRKEFQGIIYIRSSKNIGADARNLGLRKAKGEIIITLDDDVFGIIDKDIHFLLDRFGSRPRLGALNFKVLDSKSGKICNWVHHCIPEKYCETVFLTYEITEGAVTFRKHALEEAGFYPEGFFLSHEGPDLAFRIIDTGYDVEYNPAVSVIHCHSESGRRKWFNYYYDTRNLFGVATRNFPVGYSIWFLMRGLPSMLLYSIRDGYFVYWLRGILDGLAGLRRWNEQRQVLTRRTMNKIKTIDKRRPNLSYMLKMRLLRPSARL